ncbi:hypothetical protein QFZ73_002886 [Peribacillus sp. V2I11]|nr:hypothetical protein [Peribacillus sp. V2I11]
MKKGPSKSLVLSVCENIPVRFGNPLPFRRLSAKPPRRKHLAESWLASYSAGVSHYLQSIRITVKKP